MKLAFYLFLRFSVAVLLYTIGLAFLALLARSLGPTLPEIFFRIRALSSLIRAIEQNSLIVFSMVWGFGFLILLLLYMRKAIGYVDTVTQAIDLLFDNETDLVKLPNELHDIEDRLNEIKIHVSKTGQLAKEAEQRKNDLVVYLAHDLKTPLTSVIGYLTLLRDEQQISQELRAKYLSISVDKAERLEDLINEFFEVTRFNLQNLALDTTKIDLTRMLEQIVDEFKPLLAKKDLASTLTAPQDIIIPGDAKKLERVFDNLIRNAINYSYENSLIEITAVKSQEAVTIIFRNNGDTIPQHQLNHIFQQFYRLDSARSTEKGGAGLGLAISKQIIELHQGTIAAFSQDGIIQFEITLPTS